MSLETNELVRYKTGDEKRRSHAYLNRKYDLAIKQGFYFEAIMISYNLVEDRLIAFLHYAGVVSRDSDELYVTKRTKESVRKLLKKTEKQKIIINNIEVKLGILEAIICSDYVDEYVLAVREQLTKSSCTEELYLLIDECRKWKDIRNKYVHGLANKSPESVERMAETIADEGKQIARRLDNCVGRFSNRNRIRKQFKIQ